MKRIFRSKVAWGVVLAAAAAIGVFGYHKVDASVIQDCTTNSIIQCGKQNSTDFINAVKGNNPRDLQGIYQSFGLTPSDYDKFVTNAKEGMAYRDGTIKVDGRTVATDAWSIGRSGFSYSSAMNINGGTYYRSPATRVLKQDLPVMVLFDDKGVMQFAVMKACGNPTTGNKVKPSYSCDLLHKNTVEGQKNTYEFATDASAANGATVAKVVYDFGDGSTATSTNLTTPVKHTYTQAGSYTIKSTVYVSLPGGGTTTVTGASCMTQITVQAPPQVAYTCDSLQALPAKQNSLQYTFQANTSSKNAKLTGADFDFGDGTTSQNVTPNSDTTVSVDHTYSDYGKYNIKATVHFEVEDEDGQKSVKSADCEANIAPSATPTPPTEKLPDTGAGSILGIFAGASIIGGLGYRFRLNRLLGAQE